MEDCRAYAVKPGRALLDQRLSQAHADAQLLDLGWRDPGARQLLTHEQCSKPARVRAVGFGAALSTSEGARLRDLREVGLVALGADLLDAEAPAGRRLKRDLHLLFLEPREPLPKRLPRRRRDPARHHLAGLGVEPVVGDLRTVNVESNYHRHRGLLTLRL